MVDGVGIAEVAGVDDCALRTNASKLEMGNVPPWVIRDLAEPTSSEAMRVIVQPVARMSAAICGISDRASRMSLSSSGVRLLQ